MSDWPLLSLVTFLPLVGAAFIVFINGEAEIVARNSRSVALWTALVTFVVSLMIWGNFDSSQAGFQLVERAEWLSSLGVSYYMGVDGISLWFVILSTLLTVVCVVGSWYSVTDRVKEYMIAFLVMDTLMVGVFCALDIVLFYVFFEGILIPMYLIIGIWGGPRRIYASFKFFLYTLLGSVLFLIAVIVMYVQAGTTDIPLLMQHDFALGLQRWLWLALFASFAVKVPMWPFHTWLPDAHVEAPTAGSVLLAGVLLKLGGYGFLRFSLPMLPDASAYFAPMVYALSAVAIVYTSLVALMQSDMKKLIAYSSVAHMGIVTIGCFTPNALGIQGGIVQMLSHGGRVGRALHVRRCRLRPGPQPRDRLLWRPRRPDAGLRADLHAVHAGLGGAARDLRLRRRDPRHRRCLPGQPMGGVLRRDRDDPGCLLHALALSSGDLRQPDEGAAEGPGRHPHERGAGLRAPRSHRAPDGRLSLLVHATDAGVGRCARGAARYRTAAQPAGPGDRPAMSAAMNLTPAFPEVFLVLVALALLVLGAFRDQEGGRIVTPLAAVSLVLAAVLVLVLEKSPGTTFFGHFIFDRFAAFLKVVIYLSVAGALLLAGAYLRDHKAERFEYPVLGLFAALGMGMMVSANSLISLYMALELQSLPMYVLAAFHRDTVRSSEAGLKFFVLGALASGMLLYGCSLVYGFTGTLQFGTLAAVVAPAAGHGDGPFRRHCRRHRLPARGPRLQARRRALPHVDAGRLRRGAHGGHGLHRGSTQDRRHGPHGAPVDAAFRPACR